MFDEPDQPDADRRLKPSERARQKVEELLIHCELAAVFEAVRKFDAEVKPVSLDIARSVQKQVATLERARMNGTAIIAQPSGAPAAALLEQVKSELSSNDYHVHARVGEAMVIRWIEGEQVETFYQRLQAHWDAAIAGTRADEREAHEWKQDDLLNAYLKELDSAEIDMGARYLRDPTRKFKAFALSTLTADEMNIAYLCGTIMGIPPADLVGARSAPDDDAPPRELAWFFKLFSLRGMVNNAERACFFTFLQKSDDELSADE